MNYLARLKIFFLFTFFLLGSAQAKMVKTNVRSNLHKYNSMIAQKLDFKNPKNIKNISNSLKSAKDKRIFEQLTAARKGKKIKMYAFMDRLVIYDQNKVHSLRLLSISPLIVQAGKQRPHWVDSKNLNKLLVEKKKTKTAQLSLIPEAHAFFGGGDDEWEFMYAAVAQLVIEQTGVRTGAASDAATFSADVTAFLSKHEVGNLNCSDEPQATYMSDPIYGSSFTNSTGTRMFVSCGEGNLCSAIPLTDGQDAFRSIGTITYTANKVRDSLMAEARKVAKNNNLEARDFEANCSFYDGWTGDGYQCSLTALNPGKYGEGVVESLSSANLLTESQNNDPQFMADVKMVSDALVQFNRAEMNANESFVYQSIVACCKDISCSRAAAEKGLPMSQDAPTISQ